MIILLPEKNAWILLFCSRVSLAGAGFCLYVLRQEVRRDARLTWNFEDAYTIVLAFCAKAYKGVCEWS